MRKITLVLLVFVFCFNLCPSLARADGMILPEALNPAYLTVRHHHVTVDIADNHAVTRVEQVFYNPYDFPVNGRYLFPVPPDAILSHFEATLDGQPQAVMRQDAAATNAILFDVVAQQRDPSLLQYADWETLAFDLSLEPGALRRMTLEYEEVLAPVGGFYRYYYVLSTERYSAEPLQDVSINVNLDSSAGLANLYSPTHDVDVEQLPDGGVQVSWQAQDVLPTEDFELFFAPAEGGFGAGLLNGRWGERDHFMFLFAPDFESSDYAVIPKDIVFVIDRSGSMAGEKIEQARNALHFILGQLGENDRFSIVGFDDELLILADSLLPATLQNLDDARRFVDRLNADGGTDLEAALQASLRILDSSETRQAMPIVVFLTDGLPTAGVTDQDTIARLVTLTNAQQSARLHVFGVGYDVNTHLLDRLAEDNGGTVTYVQPGENLEAVLTGFYRRIAHPLLTDVQVEFEGMQVSDLYPQRLPDMFQGSSLLLTGRYQADSADVVVRVRGLAAGEPHEYVYHFVVGEQNHDFVPRLWATRRVGDLLDRVRVEGERAELVDEIRQLGLSYGLVTPYTTFVIQAQAEGAASAANMDLYNDQAELNQAWGQTTVQARVQNQMYQQASQANLASGANVHNYGQRNLAKVAEQNVDLELLQNKVVQGPVTAEWIEQNIHVDRRVSFASKAYFELAQDPDMRAWLQSGVNVVFAHEGQVIAVQEGQVIAVQESQVIGTSQAPDYVELLRATLAEFKRLLEDWARFNL